MTAGDEKGTNMATQQLLIRLPEDLARRLKRRVPTRGRSAFVQALLEQALPPDEGEDDPLYRAALAVEQDERLAGEMAEWDAVAGDGLALEVSEVPRG
jgi:plasmid stability protein